MDRRKLIYSIMKQLEQGIEPKPEDYALEMEQWGEIAELIRDEGLAKNLLIQRGGIGNKVLYAWYSSATITLDGVEYLETNSMLAKTYSVAKELRDWIKL